MLFLLHIMNVATIIYSFVFSFFCVKTSLPQWINALQIDCYQMWIFEQSIRIRHTLDISFHTVGKIAKNTFSCCCKTSSKKWNSCEYFVRDWSLLIWAEDQFTSKHIQTILQGSLSIFSESVHWVFSSQIIYAVKFNVPGRQHFLFLFERVKFKL